MRTLAWIWIALVAVALYGGAAVEVWEWWKDGRPSLEEPYYAWFLLAITVIGLTIAAIAYLVIGGKG